MNTDLKETAGLGREEKTASYLVSRRSGTPAGRNGTCTCLMAELADC
jgi:hypothetical protein